MPLNSEIVPNRPLASHELRQIIEQDVHAILMRDGMLTGQIAYGRCSYKVTVELLLDNFTVKRHVSTTASAQRPKDVTAHNPELAAIEAHPLKNPSIDAVASAQERERTIDSPNRTRIEEGLPLTATVRQGDGLVEKKIEYSPDDLPPADAQIVDRDVSDRLAEAHGLLSAGEAAAVHEAESEGLIGGPADPGPLPEVV